MMLCKHYEKCNICPVLNQCPILDIKVRTINITGDVYDEKIQAKRTLTVASISVATYPLNEEKTKFMMACSFRNPQDKFDRKRGHMISKRKLMFSPPGRKSIIEIEKEEDKKLIDTIKDACMIAAEQKNIKWMKKFHRWDLK